MKHIVIALVIVASSTLLTSLDVAAEERLIAVIMAASQPRYQEIHTSFQNNSSSFCGDNCKIYVQTPNADTMSLRNSVRKAVALGSELIVTYGPSATMAAKLEATSTPVLFADVYDPVKLELVSEKTGVGHRMTGVRGDAPVQALFKYFAEAAKPDTLAVLVDSGCKVAKLQGATLVETGKRRDVHIFTLSTKSTEDHVATLAKLSSDPDGLFIANSDHANSQLSHVIEYATERKIPVITQRPGAADKGAFMALETSSVEQGERLARMADKLLSGTDLADLPLEKPREVSFVVNLEAAQTCGIKVPFTVLSNATRVVK